MQTIDETRAEITRRARRGDYTVVAGLVGLAADTVGRIVSGKRHNDAVIRRFVAYLDKRDEFEKQLVEGAGK